VGAQPSLEVVAKGSDVVITRHPPGNAPADVSKQELADPLQVASHPVHLYCPHLPVTRAACWEVKQAEELTPW
jgi:hypothetical protein